MKTSLTCLLSAHVLRRLSLLSCGLGLAGLMAGCGSTHEHASAAPPAPPAPPAPAPAVAPVAPAPPAAAPPKAEPVAAVRTLASTNWIDLFDGESLAGWKVTAFAGAGEVTVEDGRILMGMGAMLTGIHRKEEPPANLNYEVSLEAMKVDGSDFFCGLTVPFRDSHCSLIVGGWGGGLIGVSSIDGMDASENETTKFLSFDKNRWYSIRLRVTGAKLEAWIDGEKLIDVKITDRKVSLRPGEIEMSVPMGVAAYQTTAALRNIRMRGLAPGEIPAK